MEPAVQPSAAARAIRIIHAALVIGSVLVGITFFLVVRLNGASFANTPVLGYVTAGLGLANVALALAIFRPKIPRRSLDQAADDYWAGNDTRDPSIIVWAMIEGAGLVSWVGYFMTGSLVPAAVAVLSIITLITLRPGRLEGDGGA
jgi:Na+/H+-dicarboxylate symporter